MIKPYKITYFTRKIVAITEKGKRRNFCETYETQLSYSVTRYIMCDESEIGEIYQDIIEGFRRHTKTKTDEIYKNYMGMSKLKRFMWCFHFKNFKTITAECDWNLTCMDTSKVSELIKYYTYEEMLKYEKDILKKI